MKKTDAAKQRIADICAETAVNTFPVFYLPETADTIDFSVYDYIVDAVDTVKMCLTAFTPMIDTMRVLPENMRKAAANGFINATDCADYLVKKGLPFRDAYKATGTLVALCIEKKTTLEELPIDEYKKICDTFDEGVYEAISLENCVNGRRALGGPASVNVAAQAERVLKAIN